MITEGLIGIVLWSILLYLVAQSKKDTSVLFYLLGIIPRIPLILLTLLFINNITIYFVFVLLFIETVIWLMTLYEAAALKKKAWYTIIFFVPFIGWIVYKLTR